MKIALLLFILISSAAFEDQAGDEPVTSFQSLVAAERAFSRTSEKEGISKAFVRYLAEDAIIFRPAPVKGRPLYVQNPHIPGRLTWKPEFGEVARTGDLGYTTGPYEFTIETPEGKAAQFGHYISLWSREPGGSWRVVLDIGCAYEQPYALKPGIATPSEAGSGLEKAARDLGVGDAKELHSALLASENLFSTAAVSEGVLEALETFAADRIRFFRQGAHPVCGIKAAIAALDDAPVVTGFAAAQAVVSKSGDLGYTYGTYTSEVPGMQESKEARYSYLRIWNKQSEADWKIVLDATVPHDKNR